MNQLLKLFVKSKFHSLRQRSLNYFIRALQVVFHTIGIKKNSRKKRTKVFLFRTILSILSFAATIKYHQWSCNRFLTLQQNNATFTNISFNSTILSAVSLTEFKTIEIKILLWIKLAMVIVWATNARSGNYFKSRSVHYE